MDKRQLFATALLSSVFTLTLLAGLLALISRVQAAPLPLAETQVATESFQYKSVPAIAFLPVQLNSWYRKNTDRESLYLTGSSRIFTLDRNRFVAPLNLPDQSQLVALSVFGEDYDPQGEIRVRIKRCDHGQTRCVNLGEATSTTTFSSGQFETTRITLQNELVNNSFYSYFVELDLTALLNSGLRSVRIEMITKSSFGSAEVISEPWALSGGITSFTIPNSGVAQVRVCTDDLDHLDNATHFPFVVVDNRSVPLSSNACVTVLGRGIEIRRRMNTGPSSGTYQILN